MKRYLLLSIVALVTVTLSGCGAIYEKMDDAWTANYEHEALLRDIAAIENQLDDLDGLYAEDEVEAYVDELQDKVYILEHENRMYKIYMDVLLEREYVTYSSSCGEYVCYNNYFYYDIVDGKTIRTLFGRFGYFTTYVLYKFENDNWYIKYIGYYDDEHGIEMVEGHETEHRISGYYTAVDLIVEFIKYEQWELLDTYSEYLQFKEEVLPEDGNN